LETEFLRKLPNFIPHIAVLYFSDKTKLWQGHVLPGEGSLKLPSLLKKLKQNKFLWDISLKIDIEKKDLADTEKVLLILKKARKYLQENFEDIVVE
jgi:sugar phosphate isomerase/epimerase